MIEEESRSRKRTSRSFTESFHVTYVCTYIHTVRVVKLTFKILPLNFTYPQNLTTANFPIIKYTFTIILTRTCAH